MAKEDDNKDPAFLFYSKDWIQGTAKLFAAEKGVFIDLLAHCHQDGYLPKDTKRLAKMVGISLSEFEEIWGVLIEKFDEKDGRYYNKKLTKLKEEREEYSEMRTIIGIFAQLVKKSELPDEVLKIAKKNFKYTDYLGEDKQNTTKLLTKYLSNYLPKEKQVLGIVDGIVDGDINEEDILNLKLKNQEKKKVLNYEKSCDFFVGKKYIEMNPDFRAAISEQVFGRYALFLRCFYPYREDLRYNDFVSIEFFRDELCAYTDVVIKKAVVKMMGLGIDSKTNLSARVLTAIDWIPETKKTNTSTSKIGGGNYHES